MNFLCLLESFCLTNQELEELAHEFVTGIGKDFRVELGTDNLTIRISLNHFRNAIICPTYNLQARSQFLNRLMVESIDLNFFLSQNLMHQTTFYHRYAVSSHCTCFRLAMIDVRRLFRRQVLIKCSAHAYINQLQTATNAKGRDITVASQLEESQVISIASHIHFAQLFVFFFAEVSRSEIFTTCKDDTVQLRYNLTKHFHIIGYRNQIWHTTILQYRIDISVVHRILGIAPTQ